MMQKLKKQLVKSSYLVGRKFFQTTEGYHFDIIQ